jgi:hypothetical protein
LPLTNTSLPTERTGKERRTARNRYSLDLGHTVATKTPSPRGGGCERGVAPRASARVPHWVPHPCVRAVRQPHSHSRNPRRAPVVAARRPGETVSPLPLHSQPTPRQTNSQIRRRRLASTSRAPLSRDTRRRAVFRREVQSLPTSRSASPHCSLCCPASVRLEHGQATWTDVAFIERFPEDEIAAVAGKPLTAGAVHLACVIWCVLLPHRASWVSIHSSASRSSMPRAALTSSTRSRRARW